MTSEAKRIKWDWDETADAIEQLLGKPVGRINIPLAIASHVAILKSERATARASGFSAAREKALSIVGSRSSEWPVIVQILENLVAAIRAMEDET